MQSNLTCPVSQLSKPITAGNLSSDYGKRETSTGSLQSEREESSVSSPVLPYIYVGDDYVQRVTTRGSNDHVMSHQEWSTNEITHSNDKWNTEI